MMGFSLRSEDIELPQGAWAAGTRTLLLWGGKVVLGFTQGAFRPYLFPVFTPAGFAVTSESPADHPHHHSIWVGADHVDLHVPAQHRTEVYSYNFYVNDVFQGRAPGRILQTDFQGREQGDAMVLTQQLQWRGPREWGAPDGRHVLNELRQTHVRHLGAFKAFQIEMRSHITAATHAVSVGPTRHAWFNARVGPGMSEVHGGTSRSANTSHSGSQLPWHVCTGSVGADHRAGVALTPWPANGAHDWYVSPWGVMTANPCLNQALQIPPDGPGLILGARALVFDGELSDTDIEQALADASPHKG